MQQLARGIRADLTLIVYDAHDKKLSRAAFLIFVLVTLLMIVRDSQLDTRWRHSPNHRKYSLRYCVTVVQLRFSARDANFDRSRFRKKIHPRQFLGAPFELEKSTGVKSPEPRHHSAGSAQPQICVIDPIQIAAECDATDLLSASDAECFELACGDGLEPECSGCK